MQRISALAFGLIVSCVPVSLFAKGDTVKIAIKGPGLTAPLELTSPKVGEFGVWEGPGVALNGVEQTEGFIIDWPKGIVARIPDGLQHYEVSFYTGCQVNGSSCRAILIYVVSYAFDPSAQQGFVYLPGTRDEASRFNQGMWHGHGLEGHWLRATGAWETFVRPLIATARAAGSSR